MATTSPPNDLETTVHLIQVALTPIFLLSGIAALLNVFATRLARVADRLDQLSAVMQNTAEPLTASAEIATLHWRSLLLDLAVILSTSGAVATCLAILTLFLIQLGIAAAAISTVLLLFFGLAILCTLLSAALFGWEMLASSKELRTRMALHAPELLSFHAPRGDAAGRPGAEKKVG